MSSSHGFRFRHLPYREAPDDDLAALHAIETEVEAERRVDHEAIPVDRYIAAARALPSQFVESSWLVETPGGTPVATGAFWFREGDDPRQMRIDVLVRRDWRRRGIGAELVRKACDVAEAAGKTTLGWGTFDRVPAGEVLSRKVGGRPGLETRTSELVLADVDWEMVAAWIEDGPRRAPGYTLEFLDGAYPRDAYADVVRFHDIMQTAPHDDLDMEPSKITEEFVAEADRTLVDSGRERWTLFVRDPTGRLAGGTEVGFAPWNPGLVYQGDTGIDPAHRGQGLGKWVKAAMLHRIREERPDAERVHTGNAYSNAPMLAINDTLGFRIVQSRTQWQGDVATVRSALEK